MPRAFFDTNIFLSLQVLKEYYSVATRKLGVAPDLAQRKLEIMAGLTVVRFRERDIIRAIGLHRQHQISFWDAMIILAAQLGGAETLYTEDLQHGGKWGAVTTRCVQQDTGGRIVIDQEHQLRQIPHTQRHARLR